MAILCVFSVKPLVNPANNVRIGCHTYKSTTFVSRDCCLLKQRLVLHWIQSIWFHLQNLKIVVIYYVWIQWYFEHFEYVKGLAPIHLRMQRIHTNLIHKINVKFWLKLFDTFKNNFKRWNTQKWMVCMKKKIDLSMNAIQQIS